jgi:hypothetical protein
MILVDTNVWSEATKRDPSPAVLTWARQNSENLWLSTVVLAELRGGTAHMPKGARRSALEAQFDGWEVDHAARLLPFDLSTARYYARVLERAKDAGKPIQTADAMIAATALQHGMKVATRNVNDFAGAGVELINPWKF